MFKNRHKERFGGGVGREITREGLYLKVPRDKRIFFSSVHKGGKDQQDKLSLPVVPIDTILTDFQVE